MSSSDALKLRTISGGKKKQGFLDPMIQKPEKLESKDALKMEFRWDYGRNMIVKGMRFTSNTQIKELELFARMAQLQKLWGEELGHTMEVWLNGSLQLLGVK